MASPVVWSIGYQRLDIAGLCAAVRRAGVRTVADVREAPWSQRPEFRKKALARSLREAGFEYVHRPELGNPFRGEGLDYDEWSARFVSHMDRHPARIAGLEALVRAQPTALLCVCAHSARCHRGHLLRALVVRGMRVVELPYDGQLSLL